MPRATRGIRHISAVLIVAGAALAPIPLAAQQITARIVDAETGRPLQGALAQVVTGRSTVASATSAADGRLSLQGFPSGTYAVVLSALGYETTRIEGLRIDGGVLEMGDQALTSRAFRLNPIVVSASRRREKALDAPASVHTVASTEIEERVALTTVDHLMAIPGVDIVQSGLARNSVAIRGFNTAFNTKLLTLTDNRWSSVPSLRFNAFNLIPTANEDIERMEVVLGPGSALYGPNTANGVLHIITKSPFDHPGTTVSVTVGTRSLFQASMRHAGTVGRRVGYRISGLYFRGDEWEYTDPVEAENRAAAIAEGAPEADLLVGLRDFESERYAVDGRLDVRFDDGSLATFSGGLTNILSSIEQTQNSAAQAKAWTYTYVQARFSKGSFFTQAYLNRSDAGDTYSLRSGERMVDRSYLLAGQVQHGVEMGERQAFTYGIDLMRTVPRTDGTVHGVNENDDNIFEAGAYIQSETRLSDRIQFVAAVRGDYHDHLDERLVSPRAALVVTPVQGHNVRLTFNRSFLLPASVELFADLVSSPTLGGLPFAVRIGGVPNQGFPFRHDCGGTGPCMRSPFTPPAMGGPSQFIPFDATLLWNAVVQMVSAQDAQAGALLAMIDAPTSASVGSLMRVLNPSTGSFDLVSEVADVPPPSASTTTAFEIGYKGVIRDRLFLGIDVYRSRVENLISPGFVLTPNVFLEPQSVGAHLASEVARLGLPVPSETIEAIATSLASLPLATVVPENNPGGGADILLTFRNFGEVTYWGADLAATLLATDAWRVSGSYSFVSEDLFEGVGGLRDVAMNGPRNKGSLGVEYSNEHVGFALEVRGRFVQGFPFASGLWVGDVDTYELVDARASYALPFSPGTRLTLSASNLFDNVHREGVGTPLLGRMVMLRVSREF